MAKMSNAEYADMMEKATREIEYLVFRDLVRPLACREQLRPKHWQRKLFPYFDCECGSNGNGVAPEFHPLIVRAIDEMMNESRAWCNPMLFDEAGARAALQKAFATIRDSIGTDGASEPPVDVAARTAALAREIGL